MSIKNDLNYIKNELSSDEKLLENAFKLEILYKRYKYIIWTLVAVAIIAIAAYSINLYYVEYNANKYSAIYNSLLENPNDSELQDSLKNGNDKLYKMFVLQQALKNGNLADLQTLSAESSKDGKSDLVQYLALYYLGSFERNLVDLEKIDKYTLGDLAKLQQAYVLINDGKLDDAKNIISKIPQDSALFELSKFLSHYMISKR